MPIRGGSHYPDHVNLHVTFSHLEVDIIMIMSTCTCHVMTGKTDIGFCQPLFSQSEVRDFRRMYDNKKSVSVWSSTAS